MAGGKTKDGLEYLWTDKKRTLFGLPLSFTRYYLTDTRLITRVGFLTITEDELESTRSYLISSLKTGEDSPYQLDDFQLGQGIGGYDYTAESLAESLKTVTVPEIQAAAQRLKLDTVYFLCGEVEA